MPPELNQDDLETLVNLLLISSKIKAREALCISIGISYYKQLGFMNDLSEESFAINLISHLHDVGNTKALCKLCCRELEPIFKGGKRELILKEIVRKLNCTQENKNNYRNSDETQHFNPPQVSRNGSIFGRGLTRLGKKKHFGAIIFAFIMSFLGIFMYKNLWTTHLPTPQPTFSPVAPNPNIEYVKFQGETCPTGYSHVSLSEAADINNRDKLCNILGKWDIARLANGASMDGKGYGCKVRSDEIRGLGHSLCRL